MSLHNEISNYASWCHNLCKKSGLICAVPNVSCSLVSKHWHYFLNQNKRIKYLVSQLLVTALLELSTSR